MRATELRQSILEAAVQGKLVPQNPQDEPASELLKCIDQEKARLIKEGKIKKGKSLSPITECELPYDLPSGWAWSFFSNVAYIASNLVSPKGHPDLLHIAPDNIVKGTGKLLSCKSVRDDNVKSNNHMFYKGQIIYSKIRPSLKKAVIAPFDGLCSADMYPIWTWIDPNYMLFFMLSELFTSQVVKNDTRVKMPKTNQSELLRVLVPVPPLKEQKLIAKKVDELMTLCGELEAEEKKLEALESHFTEYLPKSILQEAVRGRLVPQDAHDEPASELLKKVCPKRKLQSVKENAIPFAIPDSWKWTYISSIGELVRGSGIKRNETVTQGLPCVRYGEIYTTYNTVFSETVSFIPRSLFDKCKHIKNGDVLMTLTGENKPDIAKSVAYLGTTPVAIGGDLVYWTNHGMNPLYLSYLMASPYAIEQKIRLATGDMIVHISAGKLGTIPIPIPPFAEQNRIVAKIEELLALCSEMKATYVEPVEFDEVAEIIPFPASATVEQTEESAEPLLLAARGDVESLSSDALKAMDDLFAEDTE